MRASRLAVSATAALVALAALAGPAATPAAADPPGPTDYRSTVTAIEPSVDGVDAAVVGGDAFLELRVDEGHEAEVAGYDGEPYLRIRADGTVERNRRSEATYLNDDRLGAVDIPPEADNEAEPDWERVAGGGTYAWHDHRIHWMGSGAPPGVEPGELVQEWAVPLTVDGVAVEVRGELVRAGSVSAVPWLAVAVAGAAAVGVLGRRRRPRPAGLAGLVAPVAALAAAVGALVAGWGQYAVAPAGSGADPLLVAVPLAGVLAGLIGVGCALGLGGTALRSGRVGPTATLAAAAAAIGWAVLRLDVLWTPVLPTDLPAGVDRAITALALGIGLASAGLVVLGGLVPASAAGRRTAVTEGGGVPR
jgi:hypothetical protein